MQSSGNAWSSCLIVWPPSVAPPLHAPAPNESDEQVWKVSLHHLRKFGSILNIRAAVAVNYVELQQSQVASVFYHTA